MGGWDATACGEAASIAGTVCAGGGAGYVVAGAFDEGPGASEGRATRSRSAGWVSVASRLWRLPLLGWVGSALRFGYMPDLPA